MLSYLKQLHAVFIQSLNNFTVKYVDKKVKAGFRNYDQIMNSQER